MKLYTSDEDFDLLHLAVGKAARLGTGTASSSTFLSGDSTFAEIASSDLTMSDEQTAYRAALRNFPATVDLGDIVWPSKP